MARLWDASKAVERSGGLMDAMVRLSLWLDDYDHHEDDGEWDVGGYLILMDDVGDIRIYHPLFIVEFLTNDGESWVVADGLHPHYRDCVIEFIETFIAWESDKDLIECSVDI